MASATTSLSSGRSEIGAQRPRLSNLPEWSSTAGDAAIQLAAAAGISLDDWQEWFLRHAMGERPDGGWSALTVGLCVGRQNGKNEITLVRELAGLLLLGERLILHTAHLQKAADTQFRRMLAIFGDEEKPEFFGRMARKNSSYGMQEIELHTGQRIIFTTRQGSKTGRSLTLDLVVYDEPMYLSGAETGAIAPAMSARSMDGMLQTWYTGSAPDAQEPDHDGVPFARVREAALNGAKDVLWGEWSIEGTEPGRVSPEVRCDPKARGEANPAKNIRISEEWIDNEMTVGLSGRDYDRERLGVGLWPDPSEDSGRVISREAWAAAACRDESQTIATHRMFALDLNPDHTWGSIGVAGERPDGLWHVAVVDRRRAPATWMVKRCVELAGEYPDATFVADVRGPAHNLIEPLKRAGLESGLRVIEADTTDYGVACADFFDGVVNGSVRYPVPQVELDQAVADASTRRLGDRWAWDRRSPSSADISPLVACTLALWGAHTQGVPEVHDLNEIAERMRREREDRPEVSTQAPEQSGTGFVPIC
jgi:hypothetical protein